MRVALAARAHVRHIRRCMAHSNDTPGASAGQPLPREFTDSVGTTWTVREITPGPMPEKLSQLLGEDRRRSGWLLFMSGTGEKRRLAPVPPAWAGLTDADLEVYCMRARRVPPAPARRSQDHEPPT
jgi:hypothetical protein